MCVHDLVVAFAQRRVRRLTKNTREALHQLSPFSYLRVCTHSFNSPSPSHRMAGSGDPFLVEILSAWNGTCIAQVNGTDLGWLRVVEGRTSHEEAASENECGLHVGRARDCRGDHRHPGSVGHPELHELSG